MLRPFNLSQVSRHVFNEIPSKTRAESKLKLLLVEKSSLSVKSYAWMRDLDLDSLRLVYHCYSNFVSLSFVTADSMWHI